VGKTALAIQWAHRAAGRFPDGQLYVNLRGYDPDRPMLASEALAGFLRSLGVGGQDIPAEEEQQAARYRSLLAGRRVLIVLDNAGSVEQVRPLLPGSASCAVLVTSRDALAGLVARDGAARLELDLLPPAEAVGLLRELIGPRASADPGAAGTLAGQCGRLPLALRVAAELAAARPDTPLADLSADLADQRKRLDLLDAGGDPGTAVRAVFSWSYRYLDAGAARAFRLAGLHPGPGFDAYAIAALTGTPLEQARRALDVLARAHLVRPAAPGRYDLHDLLRAYACELAAAGDDGNAALTRLFDHYLHTAAVAMDALHPAECHRRPRIPRPATPGPPVTEPAAALRWLDDQRACLVAVAEEAAARGCPRYANDLSATLFRYLDLGSYHAEAATIHTRAYRAAQQAGDRAAEGRALVALGASYVRQHRSEQAAAILRQALGAFCDAGDQVGQARALHNLSMTVYDQGRYQEAAGYSARALVLFRAAGEKNSQASALTTLGSCDERRGRYGRAADHNRHALALYRETGNRHGEGNALGNLGIMEEHQGRYAQAADYHRQALEMFRETGGRIGEIAALNHLGRLELRQDRLTGAADYHRQALALSRQARDRIGEAEALGGLGAVLLAGGQPDQARTQYLSALELAIQADGKYEQAQAHDGLGQAGDAAGDPGRACYHWRQALALYTGIGSPEADAVRAQLAAADDDHR
jgi:tetratricopeptide (TPR) repeat protein